MQFLRDQATQRVEAILTAGMPIAFCFQKLLRNHSPRLPMLTLGDHRLASVLEPLDPGSQRVTFLHQFIDLPGPVSPGSGSSAMLSSVFGLLAAIGFRCGRWRRSYGQEDNSNRQLGHRQSVSPGRGAP
jgi:hypothetical protein